MNPLDGVWRLTSLTSDGAEVGTGQTHLVIRGERCWEAWERQVIYDDQLRESMSIAVDPEADPPRVVLSTRWLTPAGEEQHRSDRAGIYAQHGQTLRLLFASVEGEPAPTSFDDEGVELLCFVRETDPAKRAELAEPPRPIPRPRREHARLGLLRYDQRVSWWTGMVDRAGDDVDVSFVAELVVDDAVIDERADRIERALEASSQAAAFAARALIEEYNARYRHDDVGPSEPALEAPSLADRLSLDSLILDGDDAFELYFDDGGAFWGQTVLVSLDPALEPTDAQVVPL